MPGLVLGIETATALGGVAVVSGDGRLLGEITLLGRESHSERIIPAAGELLEALGARQGDLVAVAVSSGPGSFTGLRRGLAARQLRLAVELAWIVREDVAAEVLRVAYDGIARGLTKRNVIL